jgi:3'(2'), 5'-bisphosphate nucleotidase
MSGQAHPDLSVICATAREAALEAGRAIMAVYTDFDPEQVQWKGDQSPLTQADLAADRAIGERLRREFPDIPYISEESGDLPFDARVDLPLTWLVDPLDGTKEFIKKNGEFTVNIALLAGGEVVAGVVSAPASAMLFWAAKGLGAWRMGTEGPERIRATPFRQDQAGLRLVASRSHRDAETEAFTARFREPVFRAMGSSLKILLLACGEAEVYPRFAPTMEWDTAAAQIILEEAGGRLVHAETRQALRYNKPDRLNPHFIAYGHLLQD